MTGQRMLGLVRPFPVCETLRTAAAASDQTEDVIDGSAQRCVMSTVVSGKVQQEIRISMMMAGPADPIIKKVVADVASTHYVWTDS